MEKTFVSPLEAARTEPVGSFKIQVAQSLEAFSGLWPRTGQIATCCYALQCADVLQVWCNTIGRVRGTEPLFVAVFDDFGRPMLLLPLGIESRRGLRILRFLDGTVCDYNAPVIFEPMRRWDRNAVMRMWDALIRALPRFDIAVFEKMPSDIYGIPNPFIWLDATRYRASGHLLKITGSWENYANTQLPFKRESIIQRRRLEKLGRLTFMVADNSVERGRVAQAMLSQKSQRFVETRGTDPIDRGIAQFYTEMTERFAGSESLIVAALKIDDEILSTNWGLVSNGNFLGLVTSFAGGEWKRFSTGRLLLEDLLRWAFASGIKTFDFGIGDETYKTGYCNQSVLVYQAELPITLIGKFHCSNIGKFLTRASAYAARKLRIKT